VAIDPVLDWGEYGLVANVHGDKVLRDGAKIWILWWNGGGPDRVKVVGISKGGRRVTKFVPRKRLSNVRAAWIPKHIKCYKAWSKEYADKVAATFLEVLRERRPDAS
jgi:hypothetical protein